MKVLCNKINRRCYKYGFVSRWVTLIFCWSAEFYNACLVFFVDSQTFIMTFMIQTFVLGIICLFNLLVIRKITPIPIVMETWKGKNIRKSFLSVPVIHDPSNLPHVSSSIPIHTGLLSADHPRILRPPNNSQRNKTLSAFDSNYSNIFFVQQTVKWFLLRW